ncbi:hypothetical protein, partial [Nocardia asiatica]
MRNKILCLICCDFVAAGSRAVFDLQRLRRCVFAAPLWLGVLGGERWSFFLCEEEEATKKRRRKK